MATTEDRQCLKPEASEDLPAQLCGLLTEQIACARQGNLGQVERLGARVSSIIAAMHSTSTDLPVRVEPQRNRLQRLYDELVLALKAEQAEVQTELQQLRQVKRVVGVYNRKKQRR